MHILFLTDNFPPEVNAPASRTYEHCREWVKAGHEVTVITCVPNFPRGQVYDGYKNKLWQIEAMSGIRVLRVWTYIAANEGFLKRILDYTSFMVSSVLATPFVRAPDVVVATSPQLFTACSGYVAGKVHRIPFVFELRDIWPETIKAVGAMRDTFIIRIFEFLEMFLYTKATLIVSVTNSFKEILIKRGVDASKIKVITNGVDSSRFRPMLKDTELVCKYGLRGKFVAGYVGTHGMSHALETVLYAAEKLMNINNAKDIRIIFLGDGARKAGLKQKALDMRLDNVIFIDSVPKEEVPRYWSLLDVSIIHLKKTALFENVIPSKLFECMGMGIPVLHGVAGESADIVEQKGVGIVFEPENADALCENLLKLRKDEVLHAEMRARCLAAAGEYDRSHLAGSMLKTLEQSLTG